MDLHSAQRILLCLRYGIGDVVMETPVLESLRRLLPSAHIKAIGARPAIELLENDPRIDELVCVQDWGLRHWGDSADSAIKAKITDWLCRQEFDLILDVSHAVAALREVIWERETAILDTDPLTRNVALQNGEGGLAAIKMAVREGWGMEVPVNILPRVHMEVHDLRFAEKFLHKNGLNGSLPMGLSPVSSSVLKRWPVDRLAAVADRMVEENGCRLLLFCGPQQETAMEFLRHMEHSDAVTVVGSIHLRRVAALLAHCAAFICNDTGLMHLSAAVGTPVVAVFGPTSPVIYLPSGMGSTPQSGWSKDCPHRRTTALGPPECIASDTCFISSQSCICEVEVPQVMDVVRDRIW